MTIIWIDLETTGLDPDRDVILEVAAVATDDDLRQTGPELAKRWRSMVYDTRPPKTDAHRAMADVRASIATLDHYRASGFILGE